MNSAVNHVSTPEKSEPAPPINAAAPHRLFRGDFVLLTAFCLLLFGYEMFSGRPLSLHEARLPETSREMLATHTWLFPQSGGRPWLERPPLPHWILIGVSLLLGQHVDSVWVVRLPSVLMGLSIVLMTASMAAIWFGRHVGLLSGFVLATMYEFYAYSVLAEDDIFLAAIVTLGILLFVTAEFNPERERDSRLGIVGNRPWRVWAFFFVLGLMNIVKSPLLGPVLVLGPVGVFLLWNADVPRIRRYVWLWGAIIFGVLFIWWTKAASHRYPDVVRNWRFDYEDTKQYDQPFWYYGLVLLAFCQPWILAAITGMMVTARNAFTSRLSSERFLWCWAIMPVVVLSIPHRKHHHYLLPGFAPWAILSAIGLTIVWRDLKKLPGRPLHPAIPVVVLGALSVAGLVIFRHQLTVSVTAVSLLVVALLACVGVFFWALSLSRGALAAGTCFVGVAFAYCWGQSAIPDMVAQDTAFLHRVDATVPHDQPLFVNSDLGGEMDFFRNQFYLRPTAVLLHNLTFLRDDQITGPDAWVVTRRRDMSKLEPLGQVEVADESAKARRERSPDDRFTLFHIHFNPGLKRYPRPPYVNTLQAMGREPGPFCGPDPATEMRP
jgi:4-amino-4-deoxy-L-arabinose transferase-like glycosyltransferase